MPGLKRKTFKRKGKKAFRKGKKGATAGVKALAILKGMQRKIEYKHNDYPILAEGIDASGICYPLVEAIPKGDENYMRNGDLISLARAHIYLQVTLPIGVAGPDTRSFRVMLVRGIRENGLIPVMSYSSNNARGIIDDVTVPVILGRKAEDNIRNTKILWDKIYTLTPGQRTKMEFRWNFKLGWNTTYQKGTSNLVEDGGLYLLMCSDFGNDDLIANMNHRITFSDL